MELDQQLLLEGASNLDKLIDILQPSFFTYGVPLAITVSFGLVHSLSIKSDVKGTNVLSILEPQFVLNLSLNFVTKIKVSGFE